MEKTITRTDSQKSGLLHSSPGPSRDLQPPGLPFFDLPRTVGNQAMGRLFESGGLRAKLRVSQPGDGDEEEADRVAEQVVKRERGPVLQRKCDCGGSCTKCQEEENVIHRSALGPLRWLPLSIQRAEASGGGAGTTKAERDESRHPGGHPQVLVVEDEAPKVEAGQMRKRQFVSLLQTTTCATADAVLEAVGHTTKGCPYIKKWLGHYQEKSAAHLMSALHKYAPETRKARSAHEAIALLNQRVERAALSWAKTGKVSGLPEGIQEEMMGGGGGFLGAVAGFAKSGLGKGLLGFIGGGGGKPEFSFGGGKKKEGSEGEAVQKKANQGGGSGGGEDAAAVKEQLGSGQALDGRVQGAMSSAFGYDFSGVRVHTDTKAGELSTQLNARAFTIGSDVAFAGGEYKPGTLVGDALIAHELAHVVQQGGGKQGGGAQTKSESGSDNSSLEQDADRSAVGAVVSAWTGVKNGLTMIGANALPRLKSGLKLQKCSCNKSPDKKQDAIKGCLDDLYAGGCHFPGSDVWKYDDEYWERAPDPDYVAYKPKPGVTPSQAMDKLYERLSKWDLDCALYPEVARLCTYRRTLEAEEFNKQFSGLRLRQHESPGVATEFHDIENEDAATFNKLWDDAPAGSKVMWTNRSPITIHTAWNNENAIKRTKGEKPEDDRYDAHPLGKNFTEAEVMRGLAENADDFPAGAAAQQAYIQANIYRHQLHILKF
jgi:hypothetical protein